MDNGILTTAITGSVALAVAGLAYYKNIRTEKKVEARESREVTMREAYSSIEGWKQLNAFMADELGRGNTDRINLWQAHIKCEDDKHRLELKVDELQKKIEKLESDSNKS